MIEGIHGQTGKKQRQHEDVEAAKVQVGTDEGWTHDNDAANQENGDGTTDLQYLAYEPRGQPTQQQGNDPFQPWQLDVAEKIRRRTDKPS